MKQKQSVRHFAKVIRQEGKVIFAQYLSSFFCLISIHKFYSSYIPQVYAVASEDMDSLTFGAPRFLRHLMDPSSKKIPVMEFEIAKVTWYGCIVLICSSLINQLCLLSRFWRSLSSPWINSSTCVFFVDVTTVIVSKVPRLLYV